VDLSSSATVASGGNEIMLLQPSKGYIYDVIEIGCYIPDPSGSASGTHYLTIIRANSSYGKIMQTIADFGNAVKIDNYGLASNKSNYPSATRDYCLIIINMEASNAEPIRFRYYNSTDVSQTGNKILEIWVRKHREAKG
jgi:hypothetical protein